MIDIAILEKLNAPAREERQRVQDASLFPVYYGSAKKGLGINR